MSTQMESISLKLKTHMQTHAQQILNFLSKELGSYEGQTNRALNLLIKKIEKADADRASEFSVFMQEANDKLNSLLRGS